MRKQKMIELAEIARNGYHEPEAYIVEKYDDGTEVCIDILTKEINHSWPHCRNDGDTVVYLKMPAGRPPRKAKVSYKAANNKPKNAPFSTDANNPDRRPVW
jgi:hypothetical protein